MRITAQEPLVSTIIDLVKRILKESKRPHEALRDSFTRYRGIDDAGIIRFDSMDSNRYVYEINE